MIQYNPHVMQKDRRSKLKNKMYSQIIKIARNQVYMDKWLNE